MWRARLIKAGLLAAALGLTAAAGAYAQSPEGPRILGYALMNGSNSIAVIDLAEGSVVGRFSVEGNPHGGAITPDGRYIYAASMGSEKIRVVDVRGGATIAEIELGSISHHAIAGPDGRYIYIAADDLVVVDTATNEVVARIATREPPFDLAFTPDGRLLYALGIGSTISVIDPGANEVVDTIAMSATSIMGHLAFRPGAKELYVTNDADNTVSVIDTERRAQVATIPVGEGPHGIATSADGRHVVVTNRGESTFSVIDGASRRVVATREVGLRPEHVSLAPDGRSLLMGINTGSNRILMIDPTSFETMAEIDVWSAPHAFVFSPPHVRPES